MAEQILSMQILKQKLPEQFPVDEILNEKDRLVRGWISVEAKDSQDEIIPISEMKKALNTWMDRGSPITDQHSNRVVGKGLRWYEQEHEETEKPGILLEYKIFDDYSIDDEVWDEIKSGKRKGLSFGGRATEEPKMVKDEVSGEMARELAGIEAYEVATVEDPANKLSENVAVNFLAKSSGMKKEVIKSRLGDVFKDMPGEFFDKMEALCKEYLNVEDRKPPKDVNEKFQEQLQEKEPRAMRSESNQSHMPTQMPIVAEKEANVEDRKQDHKVNEQEVEELNEKEPRNMDSPYASDQVEVLSKGEIQKPFAGYKDFDACVAGNQDKDDPNAYCAVIMRQVEGKKGGPGSGRKQGGTKGFSEAAQRNVPEKFPSGKPMPKELRERVMAEFDRLRSESKKSLYTVIQHPQLGKFIEVMFPDGSRQVIPVKKAETVPKEDVEGNPINEESRNRLQRVLDDLRPDKDVVTVKGAYSEKPPEPVEGEIIKPCPAMEVMQRIQERLSEMEEKQDPMMQASKVAKSILKEMDPFNKGNLIAKRILKESDPLYKALKKSKEVCKAQRNDFLKPWTKAKSKMEQILKARKYLKPGEKAPKGASVQTGPKGGKFIDTAPAKKPEGKKPNITARMNAIRQVESLLNRNPDTSRGELKRNIMDKYDLESGDAADVVRDVITEKGEKKQKVIMEDAKQMVNNPQGNDAFALAGILSQTHDIDIDRAMRIIEREQRKK